MVHILKGRRLKWDKKAKQCILVGYPEDVKGYRVYNSNNNCITTSRDVVVIEEGIEKEQDEVVPVHISQESINFEVKKEMPEVSAETSGDTNQVIPEQVGKKSPEETSVKVVPEESKDGWLLWSVVIITSTADEEFVDVSDTEQPVGVPEEQETSLPTRVRKQPDRYTADSNSKLKAFVDVDWASNVLDRRSYNGFFFVLSGGAISWETRKQATVALSSTEAEYMGISDCCKEALFLRNLQYEITKEIANISNNVIKLEYLNTSEMPADLLTKGLNTTKHYTFLEYLGLLDV
ncbi:unnamed protein product [Hermetia illucens]|uniref:Retroviral polymerase SH3-like domain-containing protein n=1 Tax=Hermetia illucens TaxID=343691 RepID=A0A7R8YTF1_HERIL|nr:unnamed protein product [Hermetia illucens]